MPSDHVKNAILNTVLEWGKNKTGERDLSTELREKIKIVPHGVDFTLFKPGETETKRPFTFIANKGWSQGINDRGGLQWLFKAYCEEFTNKDNVSLKVKINPTYCHPGWDINDEISKLNIKKQSDSPELQISTDLVEYKIVPIFYENADVFVSPTMAEAFNLPIAEAMACGLPVITTNFGGQTDFVNKDNGWLIDGKFTNITLDKQYEGIQWMKPDLKELRKVMRYCYEHQDEVKQKGKQAFKDIQEYSWRKSAEKAINHLKEL